MSEAKGYLVGKIRVHNAYRACYTIAKFFKSNGTDARTALETITEWTRSNHIDIGSSLASCVWSAYENGTALSENKKRIFVSPEEAREIGKVATTKKERLMLLALLCCSKAFADERGLFTISFSKLASWIGCDAENLRSRELKVMRSLKVVDVLSPENDMRGWKKGINKSYRRYRINILSSDGDGIELKDNNIMELYDRLF